MGSSAAAAILSLSPTTPPPLAARRDDARLPLHPGAARRAALAGNTRFLDGLRGLAALYVLLHHALRISGARPADCAQHQGWARLHHVLERVFHQGYLAVIFFFVLSGLVIHLRQARDGGDANRS